MKHWIWAVWSLAAAGVVCACLGSCSQLTTGYFPPDLGEKASTPAMDPGTGTYGASLSVAISTSTEKATIYYTTDGSTPTTSSHVYVSPIAVTSNMTTIQAIAVRDGLKSSSVASNTYVISSVVATPQLSPSAGTYSADQTVTITCATTGATIHYTTDGSTPTATSPVFSSGVSVSGDGTTTTIQAMATKPGMTDSGVASASYTINYSQVSTPQLSPSAGAYSADQTVTITCSTTGATIHYTTDGSTPTATSPVFSSGVSVSGDGTTTTIRAMATRSGMTDSSVASATYTITYAPVSTPFFSPTGGTYLVDQAVTIGCGTTGATIHYTTDGSTPSTGSPVYSAPVTVSGDGTTMQIRALAVKSGMTNSTVASASYTINYILMTPLINPGLGRIGHMTPVQITCGTPGASIMYTTDGSTPTESGGVVQNGILYTGPFLLPYGQTTVMARSFKVGKADSGTTVANLTETVYAFCLVPSTVTLQACQVNVATGALTGAGSQPIGSMTSSVAADATGKFVYVADSGSKNINAFSINPNTGALTPVSGQPFSDSPYQPYYLVSDLSGKFLYVSSSGNSAVSGFSINSSTGALTSLGALAVTIGNTAGLAVAPNGSGQCLYVAIPGGGQVQTYQINPSTGALTLLGSYVLTSGTGTIALAADPAGRFLYAVNQTSASVTIFTISPTSGALTNVGLQLSAGFSPVAAAVDPISGLFLYVADSAGSVYAYTINQTTGVLTLVNSYTAPTATSLSVDPSGKWLYVASGSAGSVSSFQINRTTGALSPLGTFATGGATVSVTTVGPW